MLTDQVIGSRPRLIVAAVTNQGAQRRTSPIDDGLAKPEGVDLVNPAGTLERIAQVDEQDDAGGRRHPQVGSLADPDRHQVIAPNNHRQMTPPVKASGVTSLIESTLAGRLKVANPDISWVDLYSVGSASLVESSGSDPVRRQLILSHHAPTHDPYWGPILTQVCGRLILSRSATAASRPTGVAPRRRPPDGNWTSPRPRVARRLL